jgi:hypothetical protein
LAQIPVINNHTGDEGEVDESWLERWPDDFTPLDPEHAAHIADLLTAGDAAPTEDPAPDPATEEEPSDGNEEENN